ncbi:MAG: efflux RND transporter periplasmic adaptor subunit [Planctomycetaceae bacterium]|nr:efflux RND transporter periplasmic adaptor subunit [Planctomycetaceae bacterium]
MTTRMISRLAPLTVIAGVCLWMVTPAASQTDRRSGIRSSADPATTPAEARLIEAFTEPYRDIAIAASEMGTLDRVMIKEGDVVSEGDIIAGLDDAVLKASLDVARAGRDSQGPLRTATADLEMKRRELEKLQELRSRDHATQQEVDRVQAEVEIAQARVQSVREELEIKGLEFRRIEAQLEQRLVRSPIGGVISEVKRDAGEFVSPSEPTIARIVQLDPLLVVFSVPLDKRNRVAKDQTIEMRLGLTQERVEGHVEYVSPTADESNTSVRVKVRLANPNGQWHSGERAILVLGGAESSDSEGTPLATRGSADRR